MSERVETALCSYQGTTRTGAAGIVLIHHHYDAPLAEGTGQSGMLT
jgi:hypothetical protein